MYFHPPVPHLGLQSVVLADEFSDPDPESIHLLGFGQRPDRRDDLIRTYPQLGADLLQRLLHRLLLISSLPEASCYADEGLVHPLLTSFRVRIRLLRSWLWFWWNRAPRFPRPDRRRSERRPVRGLPPPVGRP